MGTHPIFESDFDCLTECCNVSPVKLFANRFVTTPSQVLVTTTPLFKPTGLLVPMAQNYCLTAYCTIATGFLCYNLMYATAWKKNEMSLVPYINKDYNNMVSARISWE